MFPDFRQLPNIQREAAGDRILSLHRAPANLRGLIRQHSARRSVTVSLAACWGGERWWTWLLRHSLSKFLSDNLFSSVLKSSNMMLSVRHLKIKASFQYGLILYNGWKSAMFVHCEYEGYARLIYPSTEPLIFGTRTASTSMRVKMMDKHMAARRMPKRGRRPIKLRMEVL